MGALDGTSALIAGGPVLGEARVISVSQCMGRMASYSTVLTDCVTYRHV